MDASSLPGRSPGACPDLFAQRAFLDARQEVLDHAEVDVRLEQRGPDLAQGFVDVVFSEFADAAEALRSSLESLADGLEQRRYFLSKGPAV